ncbi:MAG: nucleotide sugar dehydrogenase, partial [Wenzhouxiangellaceae bacterium]
PVVGFDIDSGHIERLQQGDDRTGSADRGELINSNLLFTDKPGDLQRCNVHIIAVPTPVDAHKRPDLAFLESACRFVGEVIHSGDVVIFEATVYPGCTEEVCIPILEATSGLAFAPDGMGEEAGFHVGYSPERINPGDGTHSLKQVIKITSGSSLECGEFVDALYRRIVEAGTHPVSSIRVAEAAKVIENTQRDLNIALVNELALIFNRLGLSTTEVLEAAGSKWNFLPFKPGLVGGHCIGVDPYYLTYKAEAIGYHPEVILAGRRINDGMGHYIAQEVLRLVALRGQPLKGAKCLVLGLAFKENCGDIRNTRVVDIVEELQRFGIEVQVHDPWVEPEQARQALGIELEPELNPGDYAAIVLAVAQPEFTDMSAAELRALGAENCVVYDVKGILAAGDVDGQL